MITNLVMSSVVESSKKEPLERSIVTIPETLVTEQSVHSKSRILLHLQRPMGNNPSSVPIPTPKSALALMISPPTSRSCVTTDALVNVPPLIFPPVTFSDPLKNEFPLNVVNDH